VDSDSQKPSKWNCIHIAGKPGKLHLRIVGSSKCTTETIRGNFISYRPYNYMYVFMRSFMMIVSAASSYMKEWNRLSKHQLQP
jgi:hypothetical protein